MLASGDKNMDASSPLVTPAAAVAAEVESTTALIHSGSGGPGVPRGENIGGSG